MGFPHHLRLSIHESTGEHKISMALLNTKTGYTTPWHCSVASMADGERMSAPMGDFQKETPGRFEIVYETDTDGKQVASYLRERGQGEQELGKEVDVVQVLTAAPGNGGKEELVETVTEVSCSCSRVGVKHEADKENGDVGAVEKNVTSRGIASNGGFAWRYFWI